MKINKDIKQLFLFIILFWCTAIMCVQAQEPEALGKKKFFKNLYENLFKYSTLYAAGNISNSYEAPVKDYFVRTNPDGGLYDIPVVVDGTEKNPFDYRYSVGVRKLARFDYEQKGKNFYDGTENNVGLSSPTAAYEGFEYVLNWEKERERGEEFNNSRLFIRHTGKNHILKLEQRERGNVDFKYKSAEARFRLPIGKMFSLSVGAIARTHEKAYGYNPVEIWLNETQVYDDGQGNVFEYPLNPWYSLGFQYGYDDHYVTITDEETGEVTNDWYWTDPEGEVIAYSDLDFRETVFADLMNRYNREIWESLDAYAEIAPIVGFDFYYYTNNFWLHSYASWIMPHHKYFKGDEDFSYLNRNNWGLGGLIQDSKPEQWDDYQAGFIFGAVVKKDIGVFVEGEYTKFWDSEIFNVHFGVNYILD